MSQPSQQATIQKARAGVVGAGYWGPNLIRNLAELPGSPLVAVAGASANPDRKGASVAAAGHAASEAQNRRRLRRSSILALRRSGGRRGAPCYRAMGSIVVSLMTVTVTDELIDCTFGSFDRWSR